MKKFNSILILTLAIGSFTTLISHAQGNHTPPPNGSSERPPRPGNGHGPEQTKTLDEIGGYKIGDVAANFKLKNVSGKMVAMSDFKDASGLIVVFTCNNCPFSKMYEDRLIALHNKYDAKGYKVIAINPNSGTNDSENLEAMKQRSTEKNFPFPYLADDKKEVFPLFGAVRTPHVFVLDKKRAVQYIGAIDNNARSAEDVSEKYVENAVDALIKGKKPTVNFTKAIGCPVKG